MDVDALGVVVSRQHTELVQLLDGRLGDSKRHACVVCDVAVGRRHVLSDEQMTGHGRLRGDRKNPCDVAPAFGGLEPPQLAIRTDLGVDEEAVITTPSHGPLDAGVRNQGSRAIALRMHRGSR
jgi:hypothetical protein